MPSITPINPARGRQKPDTLDRIAQAIGIATDVLGTAISVPKVLQDIKSGKAAEARAEKLLPFEVALKKAQTVEAEEENRLLTDVEKAELTKKFDIPGVLLPRTVGDARRLDLVMSAKEKTQQTQKDKELDLKEKEVNRKIQEAKDKEIKGKPLGANTVLKVNEGNAIPITLIDVAWLIEDNEGLFGPIEGTLRRWNKYDVASQTVDAQMRAASQQFGRFMEGGVLRKEDEEKYRKMFPQLGDLPKVARAKLGVINTLLRNKQTSDLAALEQQGFNLEGLDIPPEVRFIRGVPYRKVAGGWEEVKR